MIADLDPNHSPQPKSHRILVVDDVPENLNLLSVMLGQEGYEVRRAPNGSMALQNVPRYCPHLILLDIMMPGMDGYEVCKILKDDTETAQIPIIFLSALNEPFDKVKAFQMGGVDYITKPFDVEEVLARVKQQLDLQDLRVALETQNQKLKEEVEERSRAEQKAFQASQAKSNFLARMSHELRTPLSTIIGYADLMLSDTDRSSLDCRNLRAILNSASHLLTLIEDVLNMTKIESGRTYIYDKMFDFQEFLSSLEEMFRIQADVKDIEFEVESIDPLPLYIQSDEIKLRQVLINLVSNALKFTVKGSVILTARAWCWSDRPVSESTNNCLLQFQVQDTGPGILPEELSSLFQAFSQTQTGRLSETGSGLGLAISRNFIRLMGGDIFVESVPQQGTCFTVEVLVKSLCTQQTATGSLSEAHTVAPESTVPHDPTLHSSPCRVLLLLHNSDLQHWLPQCLLRAGWEVRSVNPTAEPCVGWHPHLFLVEWGEVIQRLRQIEADRPEDVGSTDSPPSPEPTFIMAIVPDRLLENVSEILTQGCDRVLLPPHHPQTVLEQIYGEVFHRQPDASPSR
jgi:signal transduction histidine kinase